MSMLLASVVEAERGKATTRPQPVPCVPGNTVGLSKVTSNVRLPPTPIADVSIEVLTSSAERAVLQIRTLSIPPRKLDPIVHVGEPPVLNPRLTFCEVINRPSRYMLTVGVVASLTTAQ